jgi:hypothetical protein
MRYLNHFVMVAGYVALVSLSAVAAPRLGILQGDQVGSGLPVINPLDGGPGPTPNPGNLCIAGTCQYQSTTYYSWLVFDAGCPILTPLHPQVWDAYGLTVYTYQCISSGNGGGYLFSYLCTGPYLQWTCGYSPTIGTPQSCPTSGYQYQG